MLEYMGDTVSYTWMYLIMGQYLVLYSMFRAFGFERALLVSSFISMILVVFLRWGLNLINDVIFWVTFILFIVGLIASWKLER